MGRVARYKKIRDVDPYSKKNQGKSTAMVGIWGMNNDSRRNVKKRSRTSEKLREQKMKERILKQQQRSKGGLIGKRKSGDSTGNSTGVDIKQLLIQEKQKRRQKLLEYDVEPDDNDGMDDFDMNDIVGSVKKETIDSTIGDEELKLNKVLPMGIPSANVLYHDGQATSTIKTTTTTAPVAAIAGDLAPVNRTEDGNNNNKSDRKNESLSEKQPSGIQKLEQLEEKKLLQTIQSKLLQKVSSSNTTVVVGKNANNNTSNVTLVDNYMNDRKPNESKNAYNRRVQHETRLLVRRSNMNQTNPEKLRRKKEFLTDKKKKKKKKQNTSSSSDDKFDNNNNTDNQNPTANNSDCNDEKDNGKIGSDARTGSSSDKNVVAVRSRTAFGPQFGEQVERPPILRVIPRGGVVAKQQQQQRSTTTTKSNGTTTIATKNEHENERQREMDLLRRKVRAQYTAIKLQRKQTGEFHL